VFQINLVASALENRPIPEGILKTIVVSGAMEEVPCYPKKKKEKTIPVICLKFHYSICSFRFKHLSSVLI
jgi:hypothetical protein